MILRAIKLALFAAAVAAAIGLFGPSDAHALQATLLDDAYTTASKPTTKNGSLATILIAPGSTGFIQFDLSTLPAGTVAKQI
jgi:hypothetical protein